jgi:hypothetical protein
MDPTTELTAEQAPWGYDIYTHTEVTPKLPPDEGPTFYWVLGPVTQKDPNFQPPKKFAMRDFIASEVTMQLTADQQVVLTITGEDRYGNSVDLSGDISWVSSDESIIVINNASDTQATAVAVGPVGTASVTVSNDFDDDGTEDFQGSIAIDVIAGQVTEIAVSAGEPEDKPTVNNDLPDIE